ncbi:MAG TPA: helix-turn-helix domain-containing protein [Candidatus Elarobacter sp.]|nr:helix-turn-helix domain-containing protein [Candidatus Elarobacter sp.]
MHEENVVPARPLRRDRSETLLAFAEALARVAASGGGAQALAAHLAAALDAAVLVEDAQWKHLAVAGTGERAIPPSVRDLLPKGADGEETTPLAPPAEPHARAFPVRAGEARLGWLSVFPGTVRLGDERAGLVRLTASQIAIEISREAGGGRVRRRGFWDRLLARAYEDPLEAREDAQARGIALAPGYVAVAVEGEGLDESVATQKNTEIRRVCLDTLGTRTGEVVVVERGGGFFFLVPAPLEVDAANARTAATLIPRGIHRAGLDVKVVGGIGRHSEMLHVAQSVDEAREAMTIARRMFGGGRVVPYDDLGVYPLLHRTGATREDWRVFATRVLDPLRGYDEKHQTELVRTLKLFFDVGQNIKEAAARLNVHRHTVFYRLRQIGEIGRLDLDSPHDQLTVRAALAVDALDG